MTGNLSGNVHSHTGAPCRPLQLWLGSSWTHTRLGLPCWPSHERHRNTYFLGFGLLEQWKYHLWKTRGWVLFLVLFESISRPFACITSRVELCAFIVRYLTCIGGIGDLFAGHFGTGCVWVVHRNPALTSISFYFQPPRTDVWWFSPEPQSPMTCSSQRFSQLWKMTQSSVKPWKSVIPLHMTPAGWEHSWLPAVVAHCQRCSTFVLFGHSILIFGELANPLLAMIFVDRISFAVPHPMSRHKMSASYWPL